MGSGRESGASATVYTYYMRSAWYVCIYESLVGGGDGKKRVGVVCIPMNVRIAYIYGTKD